VAAVSAVSQTYGIATDLRSVSPGVYLYQLTGTGLSASITAGGTKFFKDDELN